MNMTTSNINNNSLIRNQSGMLRAAAAICLALWLGALPLTAQKKPKDDFRFPPLNPVKMPEVEKLQLSNGIQIFLMEDHEFPTIDMRIMVRGGAVFEPPEKTGLAVMTGQVLRQGGSMALSGDDMDRELEGMAATIETFIGQTSGTIIVSLLKEDLDRVLEILTDLLADPAFPDDKINLAKIQQKSAISRRNDQIGGITNREFTKLIYGPESPYARIQEYATIDALTREDMLVFYRRFFFPRNFIMTVWGDFDSAEMKKHLEQSLGSWEAEGEAVPPLPEVDYEYRATVNLVAKADVKQSYIMLGHIGGIQDNPDYPALVVMNSILSYERMFKKIRTDEGLAYSVWGTYGSGYRTPGIFSAGAQTKSESTVYAIELMLEEIRKIAEEEVTPEELSRAKDQYLNSFVFNFDSRAKIINRLMTYAFFDYPADFAERIKNRVEKVSSHDILRVAKKYLRPDALQILVVGNPELFDKPLDTLGEVNVIDITIPKGEGQSRPEKKEIPAK